MLEGIRLGAQRVINGVALRGAALPVPTARRRASTARSAAPRWTEPGSSRAAHSASDVGGRSPATASAPAAILPRPRPRPAPSFATTACNAVRQGAAAGVQRAPQCTVHCCGLPRFRARACVKRCAWALWWHKASWRSPSCLRVTDLRDAAVDQKPSEAGAKSRIVRRSKHRSTCLGTAGSRRAWRRGWPQPSTRAANASSVMAQTDWHAFRRRWRRDGARALGAVPPRRSPRRS